MEIDIGFGRLGSVAASVRAVARQERAGRPLGRGAGARRSCLAVLFNHPINHGGR